VFTEGKMVKRWVVNRFLITTPLFASNVHFPPFVASKTCQRYEIDTMIAASMIVPLLILIPVGKFADIFSRKMTFYVTISLYCILHLLLVYTPDPAAFTGSRVCLVR
jgi:MFS family permease